MKRIDEITARLASSYGHLWLNFRDDVNSRDDAAYLLAEVERLRAALKSICGDRCAHQNPCEARDALAGEGE